MITDRLAGLREEMAKRNIAVYIVPTADFHDSEYVGEHFKARQFITGFTGSAGTAVITMEEAGLWTDGRYFVQAAAQLEGTTVKLFKSGEEGVPSVDEYIETVCDFLEYLPPTTTIHRLAGNGLKKELIAPRWIGKKLDALNKIDREFIRRGTWQGYKY